MKSCALKDSDMPTGSRQADSSVWRAVLTDEPVFVCSVHVGGLRTSTVHHQEARPHNCHYGSEGSQGLLPAASWFPLESQLTFLSSEALSRPECCEIPHAMRSRSIISPASLSILSMGSTPRGLQKRRDGGARGFLPLSVPERPRATQLHVR